MAALDLVYNAVVSYDLKRAGAACMTAYTAQLQADNQADVDYSQAVQALFQNPTYVQYYMLHLTYHP